MSRAALTNRLLIAALLLPSVASAQSAWVGRWFYVPEASRRSPNSFTLIAGCLMRPGIANYTGREQAFVKHLFLADYVEQLVFKVGSRRDVVYVDGFSGPWKDQGENFEDTSFGIALESLRRAKKTWKDLGRGDRTMTALLVERDPEAFARLQEIVPRYPDIRIRTFNGDFVGLVPELLRAIPINAFSFVLMDPKGWKIDMQAVAPLLRRQNCEVVFNFMFTMINWSASIPNAAIRAGLEALMPDTNWKRRLDAVVPAARQSTADARKAVLVDAISETIGRLGDYQYVMETPVLFPTKNRTFYSLIYATRSPKGVEVFRDCQHAALKAQDEVRADLQVTRREDLFGMADMFGGTITGSGFADRWMAEQNAAAKAALLDGVPDAPASIAWGDLWPRVLASTASAARGWAAWRQSSGARTASSSSGGLLASRCRTTRTGPHARPPQQPDWNNDPCSPTTDWPGVGSSANEQMADNAIRKPGSGQAVNHQGLLLGLPAQTRQTRPFTDGRRSIAHSNIVPSRTSRLTDSMRMGERIDEYGVLLRDGGSFSLRREADGRFALDLRRTPVDEVQKRVRVIGTYVGDDLVDVDGISLA